MCSGLWHLVSWRIMHGPAFEFPLSPNVFICILASYAGIFWSSRWFKCILNDTSKFRALCIFLMSAFKLKEQVVRNRLVFSIQTRSIQNNCSSGLFSCQGYLLLSILIHGYSLSFKMNVPTNIYRTRIASTFIQCKIILIIIIIIIKTNKQIK